jgi:hypothetical protein
MKKIAGEAFQIIYANIEDGELRGTSVLNAATVPKGHRLIIEYVSGFLFQPPSPTLNVPVTMVVNDPILGLTGAGFHSFPAIKVNTTVQNDVFAFSFPLKMMLHPKATYYFDNVAGLAVSGYLVKQSGK